MKKLRLWLAARGADVLAGAFLTIGLALAWWLVALLALHMIATGDALVQATGLLLLVAATLGVIYLLFKN